MAPSLYAKKIATIIGISETQVREEHQRLRTTYPETYARGEADDFTHETFVDGFKLGDNPVMLNEIGLALASGYSLEDEEMRQQVKVLWSRSDKFKLYLYSKARGAMMHLDESVDSEEDLGERPSVYSAMAVSEYKTNLPLLKPEDITEETLKSEMLQARHEGIRELRKIIRMASINSKGVPMPGILSAKIRATMALDQIARKEPIPDGEEKTGDEVQQIEEQIKSFGVNLEEGF